MIRLPKSLVLAAAGAGLFTSIIGDASACDGKRGGIYRPVYRPAYTQQCQQQVYPYQQQPVQPFVQQQQFPQQFQQGQMPPQVQQLTQQGQQFSQQGQPIPQQGQQFQQQGQQLQQQGLPQQQVQTGAQAGQNASASIQLDGTSAAVANPGVAGGSAANVSAIGALGGVDSANAGGQGQAIASAPEQNATAPVAGAQLGGAAANNAAVNNAAVNNAPVASGNAAQAPAASAEQSALESALQALMGDTSAAAQPVSAAPQAAPTGEFSATISNGSTIRLSLRADGSFVWLANKAGKPSNFQGTFSVNGGSLTLLRGSDKQKLEGSFALTANGFKLRLAGQNGSQNSDELTFVRG